MDKIEIISRIANGASSLSNILCSTVIRSKAEPRQELKDRSIEIMEKLTDLNILIWNERPDLKPIHMKDIDTSKPSLTIGIDVPMTDEIVEYRALTQALNILHSLNVGECNEFLQDICGREIPKLEKQRSRILELIENDPRLQAKKT